MKYREKAEMILRSPVKQNFFILCMIWLVFGLGSEGAKIKTILIQTPSNDRKEQVTMETETKSLIENALGQTA